MVPKRSTATRRTCALPPPPLCPPLVPRRDSKTPGECPRGSYERWCQEETCVNIVFTRKGYLRSGDLHRHAQINHIVSGRANLTLRDVQSGRDEWREVKAGETVRIPPHVPHLYSFPEDTLMTEHWLQENGLPARFEAWLYTPYRSRIPRRSLQRR
eukprot:Hpha_TRINITY_DN23545_c0_g1::TRINITY_DN23545_c0_g1_i1::g.186386::m.186386